jgi:hypothetical protein
MTVPSNASRTIRYSRQALRNDVGRLHDAWEACKETRARDAIYDFLEDVYKLICLWRADESAKARVCTALKIRQFDTSRAGVVFADLIKAAVHPTVLDRRTISKWSRVLCYVDAVKLPSEPLKQFVKRKGGINDCATRYTQRQNRQHANDRELRRSGAVGRRAHR